MATHGFTGVELALVPEPSTRRPISYNHSYHPSTSGLSTHSREREGNVSRSPSQWSNLTGDDDEDDDLDEEASDGADDDDGDFAVTQTVHRTPVGGSLGIDAALTATTVATAVLLSSQVSAESKNSDHDPTPTALVQTREQEIRERLALASTQRSANTTSPSVSRLRWSPFLEQPRYIMDDDDEDEDEENEEEFTVTRVLTNAAYVPTNNAQNRGLEQNVEKEKRGTREVKEVNEEGEEEDDEDGFAITHVINNHNNRSVVPPLPLSTQPLPPAPPSLSSRSLAEDDDEEEEDGGFTITHVINNRQTPSTQRPVARNEDDTEDGFHITHTTRQRPFSSSSPAAAAIIQNDDVSSTAKGR